MQMKDTAAEGDGGRNLINQKLLLSVFKSMGAYSKYAIEMFVSIAQIEGLLTPRLAEHFRWGYFVNWRGGAGRNIKDDRPKKFQTIAVKALSRGRGQTRP